MSWVLTSNDGDITLLGPVLVEPSYGQEAAVTLRRNSTSMWTMGNYQAKDGDVSVGNNNKMYLKDQDGFERLTMTQTGIIQFNGPEIRLSGDEPTSILESQDPKASTQLEFQTNGNLNWRIEATGNEDDNRLIFKNSLKKPMMVLEQNGDLAIEGKFTTGQQIPNGQPGKLEIQSPWEESSVINFQHIHADGGTSEHKKTQWSMKSEYSLGSYRWHLKDDMGSSRISVIQGFHDDELTGDVLGGEPAIASHLLNRFDSDRRMTSTEGRFGMFLNSSVVVGDMREDTNLAKPRNLFVTGDTIVGHQGIKSSLYVHGSVHAKETISTRGKIHFRDATGRNGASAGEIRATMYAGQGNDLKALNISLSGRTTSFHDSGDLRLEGYSLSHGVQLHPKTVATSARLELQNNPPKDRKDKGTTFVIANGIDGSFDIRSSFVHGGLWPRRKKMKW